MRVVASVRSALFRCEKKYIPALVMRTKSVWREKKQGKKESDLLYAPGSPTRGPSGHWASPLALCRWPRAVFFPRVVDGRASVLVATFGKRIKNCV
jgi:hypothetical protein